MKFKAVVTPLQRWHNDNEQDDDHENDGNDGRRRGARHRRSCTTHSATHTRLSDVRCFIYNLFISSTFRRSCRSFNFLENRYKFSLSLFLVQLFVVFAVSMNVEKQLPFYELRSRVTLLTITKNVSGWNFDYSDGTSEGKVLS